MEYADSSQLESVDARIQLLEGAVFGGVPTEIVIAERFSIQMKKLQVRFFIVALKNPGANVPNRKN